MATVARGTLTINAAFLQEIKDDNLRLQQLLEETRKLVASTKHPQILAAELAGLCGELRDQLALHFALEEAYGYFEDALSEAPRLSTAAAALKEQHKELFTEIRDIADKAELIQYRKRVNAVPRQLMQRLCDFDARLAEHEMRENDLILAAFDDDLGVGD